MWVNQEDLGRCIFYTVQCLSCIFEQMSEVGSLYEVLGKRLSKSCARLTHSYESGTKRIHTLDHSVCLLSNFQLELAGVMFGAATFCVHDEEIWWRRLPLRACIHICHCLCVLSVFVFSTFIKYCGHLRMKCLLERLTSGIKRRPSTRSIIH